mgnify:CR=1 FL=1
MYLRPLRSHAINGHLSTLSIDLDECTPENEAVPPEGRAVELLAAFPRHLARAKSIVLQNRRGGTSAGYLFRWAFAFLQVLVLCLLFSVVGRKVYGLLKATWMISSQGSCACALKPHSFLWQAGEVQESTFLRAIECDNSLFQIAYLCLAAILRLESVKLTQRALPVGP